MSKYEFNGIIIDDKNPEWLNECGEALLSEGALREGETVPQAFARAATAYCYGDYSLAQRIYDAVYKCHFMFATPVLNNAPLGKWVERKDKEGSYYWHNVEFVGEKVKALPISCYAFDIPDTLQGQVDTMGELAELSFRGGGTGGHVSIRATTKKAPGPIPYMKVLDSTIGYYRQQGRRGSLAVYMDVSHPSISEHIRFRHPTGDSKLRSDNRQQMHNAVNLTDEFINAVKNNGDFDLKCPHSGKVYETVKARALWEDILETRALTGEPYLLKIDQVNRLMPETQKARGLKIRGSNLCVAPETKVLTKDGYVEIKSIEGKSVEAWNGTEWSDVVIVRTGENQKLITVKTKDGFELDCTPYHKFYLKNGKEVRACDLKGGDKLIKFDLPVIDGESNLPNAYANGFYSGDGCLVGNKQRLYFYGEKKKLIERCGNIFFGEINQPKQDRIYLHTRELNEKFFVPDSSYTIGSRMEWLAGLFDSDGTVSRNGETQSIQVASINKTFLQEVQLMLQTCGVVSKVTKARDSGMFLLPSNNGSGEDKLYNCKEVHRLLIGNGGVTQLQALGLKLSRLILTDHKPNRECSQFVKIEEIIDKGRVADTFCFTEPKRNMAMFNGILTGQCSEITLPTDEQRTFVCCLSSLNIEKFEEWKDTRIVQDLIRYLDNVLQFFIDNAPDSLNKAKFSAEQERALGLGALGWHAFLQSKSIPMESGGFNSAIQWTHITMKTIKERAVEESKKLAEERGEAPDMLGTGLRNSRLLAIAPNATSGKVANTSPSREPYYRNIYTIGTRVGNFVVKNPHLKRVLRQYGMDTEEVWLDIKKNDGSVQHLDFLSEHEKNVFKCAMEMDMHWLVEQAEAAGQYVCQAQSLNLFFPSGVSRKYVNSVHLKFLDSPTVHTLYYYRTEREGKVDTAKQIERKALVDWANNPEESTCKSCEG